MNKAIVLLSGGIDSATCAAIACDRHDKVLPIHFSYGQQTEDLEASMAHHQRHHLNEIYDGVLDKVHYIDYEHVFENFEGGLTINGKDFSHMEEDDGRSSGYVPMRNLHFITTAAGMADVLDIQYIYHGAQGGDEADYPDCRPAFMSAAGAAISKSLPVGQNIGLKAPLINSSKESVIKKADKFGVEFKYTYSCYSSTNISEPSPCGQCPACEERIAAFQAAGIEDPHMPNNV